MITEDYVSFETAKLLKEKGFDEATYHDYAPNGVRWFQEVLVNHNSQGGVACPTLQMAMKWLRKEHNLHCDIGYDFKLGWCIQITSLKEIVQDHYTEMKTYLPHKADNYPSYEEACEVAIKCCLENLI